MVSHPGGAPMMDVDRINDVLLVEVFEGFLRMICMDLDLHGTRS